MQIQKQSLLEININTRKIGNDARPSDHVGRWGQRSKVNFNIVLAAKFNINNETIALVDVLILYTMLITFFVNNKNPARTCRRKIA